MKTSTSLFKQMLCFTIALITFSLGAQTIITIDNNPGSNTTYQNLQDAHDNANPGDIIYVQPSSTSYGNLTLDKALTIVGRSHSEPGKISSIGSINLRASNVTLKGLSISQLSSNFNGAPIPPPYSNLNIFECELNSTIQLGTSTNQAASSNIDDIAVRGCVFQGNLYVYTDATDVLLSNNIFTNSQPFFVYNAATTVIANNIFRYWSNTINLYNYAPSTTLLLFNNMFIFTWLSGNDASIAFQTGDFNLTNNLTYHYGGGNVNFSLSGGSFLDSFTLANTDPLFTNVDTSVSQSFADNSSYNPTVRVADDLTLQAGSPALTGGGGGSEIGLFNNGYNYQMLGNPNGVPTLDVISYDGAIEAGGNINVTINAEAK